MNMDEEFVELKWNAHQLAFFDTLSSLRDKQVYTDATLSCGDQFYPAHRLVLSACSTFLAKTFEVTSCKAPVVLLHGIDQSTLEQLLMFMYDGQVTISKHELPKLLKAARWLGVKGLDLAHDQHKVNDAPSGSQASGEPFDFSPLLETWRQLFSSFTGTSGQHESIESAMKFYHQVTSNRQEVEDANHQSSKPMVDLTEPETSQENVSPDNVSVGILTEPASKEVKDSPSIQQMEDNDNSSSFHGWVNTESDSKLNLKGIFEMSNPVAEADSINSSSSLAENSTEISKENNAADVKKRSLKCKHCRKCFKVRKDMAEHVRVHHGVCQNYCFTCQSQFKTRREYSIHMKLHKAPAAHSCDLCEYVTHSQRGLKKHILVSHRTSESDVILPEVQLIEESKQTLQKTLQNLDRPECSTCQQRFKDETFLKEHLDLGCKRIIRIENNYQCPMCFYVSDRRRSVEDHLAKHTGIYRFRCSYCPYQCVRNHYLKEHMNKKHPGFKL